MMIVELMYRLPSAAISSLGGKFTGRSLAWNEPTVSMSMPNIDFATSTAAATSQTFPRASLGGEGGFPAEGSKKYKKHSGASKMLKKEFKLLQGKGNYRYQKKATNDSVEEVRQEETNVDTFNNEDLEVSSRSMLPPRPSYTGRSLNKTLREQNQDISDKLRDLPRSRIHGSRRSTSSNLDNNFCDNSEVISLDEEEPTSRPELEHRSSFARSLKYSRAFQQKNSAQRRDIVLNDMECEEFEEIPDAPFAAAFNFYGRRSGIVCS